MLRLRHVSGRAERPYKAIKGLIRPKNPKILNKSENLQNRKNEIGKSEIRKNHDIPVDFFVSVGLIRFLRGFYENLKFYENQKYCENQKNCEPRKCYANRKYNENLKYYENPEFYKNRTMCNNRKVCQNRSIYDTRTTYANRTNCENRKCHENHKICARPLRAL